MRNEKTASRFARGSGCYRCEGCGRQTRSTGRGDNENVRLCAECYDLAGIENEISDQGSTPEREAEAERLRNYISNRGGFNGGAR
jgi:hypothetical protein